MELRHGTRLDRTRVDRRGLLLCLAGLVLLAVACRASESQSGQTTPAPTSTPAVEASTPEAAATPPAGGRPDSVRPLSELSPPAADVIQDQAGNAGIAVMFPAAGQTYGLHEENTFIMASVAKVVIMLTLLDQHERQGRPLGDDRVELLRAMITWSDNASADVLWAQIGGGAAAQAYLRSIGLDGITMSDGEDWGRSTTTPLAMGTLLAMLASGEILSAAHGRLALQLLSEVDPSQAWGVSAGLPRSGTVGLKNGWVPDTNGEWIVNSAGLDWSSESPAVLVVLTARQPSLMGGIALIESTAGRLRASIFATARPR